VTHASTTHPSTGGARLRRAWKCLAILAFLASVSLVTQGAGAENAQLPTNLAATARITADSEFSQDYLAKNVADGCVPDQLNHDDVGRAWCVQGAVQRDHARLSFEWDKPVTVRELVYYARTAWFLNETWKDYEVWLDDAAEPAVRGRLDMRHGPQRITLPEPRTIRRLELNFTSSYGGHNPGASEVQVFAVPPTDAALARFMHGHALRAMPWVDRANPEALREFILELGWRHGAGYRTARAHLARLEADGEDLPALQRAVLLFDVERLVVIKRHEIVASHVYTYHYEGFRPGGGLYVVPVRGSAEARELVASPDGQILDCDLSYDGSTALFSWRRTEGEGYHLWTVHVDGSNLTQLTDGEWHDYNACWLPDGGIAFLSTRRAQFAYCWHAPVGVLHRMDAGGSDVRQLSANYLNDFTPAVLDDGRIIYSRWEYVDKPAIPIQSLWTVNPDGAGLSGYFGNRVLSPGTFMEARSIPGTTRILCTMTGHNGPTRGAIGMVDRAHGVNAQAAITNLTPDVPVPAVDRGNGNTDGTKQYSGPFPLDAHRFLVSARGPLLVRNLSGTCQSLVLPPPGDGMQWLCAQPVRPRPTPPVIPSVLPEPGEDTSALVYLQDVYNGLEPNVKRGEAVRIRVVREMQKTVRIDPSLRAFGFQFPVISCGATYAGKEVLGEVPVEPDGSAYFRVPSGVPLYFMVLDEHGRALQRMRSFTHLMPGEVQGCVGCHEPRRHTAQPLNRTTFRGRPRDLEPPEWGPGGFGYARIVQPVLDQYCTECHDARRPKGIDLTGGPTDFFSVSYDVLARENQGPKGSPYVNWIPTYNGQERNILEVAPKAWGSPRSKLADLVLAGHPDGDGKPRVHLDDPSRRRILAWIDLNVPYYPSSETAYPDNEGCRRLYPPKLDEVLADVAARRCAQCHEDGKVPRRVWTRIAEPELNGFLLAPLAQAAGGAQRCGPPVFETTEDADYQAILATFQPVRQMLAQTPRMDMPNAHPAPNVCRDRK